MSNISAKKEMTRMGTHLVHVGRSIIGLVCLWSLGLLMSACWPLGDPSSSTSSSTGSGSNSNKTVMTVMVKEKHSDAGDTYMFDPATITLHKGDAITITNQSDELQDIDQGDATRAGVDAKVPVNQSTTATFNTVGTFTLKSEKGATITVTVQ
jgi:plastocyanin